MNVLLLGSGGREHALAHALHRSPEVANLCALPGSDGMAPLLAERIGGDPCDAAAAAAAAERVRADLVVIGPEAPLAAGVADELRQHGRLVFGPSRAAARLESSKIFAKEFMARHRIPTARFAAVESAAAARRALDDFNFPVVIKADGLAAGKGVVVAEDRGSAEKTLDQMLAGELVGAAGRRVVLEEFLAGPEVSLLALADGARAIPLVPARDHKRIFAGDRGPNTGGMGSVSTDALLSPAQLAQVMAEVVAPVMRGMDAEGMPFQGVLYCGLMLTAAGPRVLEFNVRFGDPETQAILLRLDSSLATALLAAARGQLVPDSLRWSPDAAACVIAASGGYPGVYGSGKLISGLDTTGQVPGSGAKVFHAGTRRTNTSPEGNVVASSAGPPWETAGGRVLGVAARAPSLQDALARCYRVLEGIRFEGMQFRSDIGAAQPARPG